MPSTKARYWLLTIPVDHLPNQPNVKNDLIYLKGQQETGANSGLLHWQLLAVFKKQVTLNQCKGYFCPQAHCEASRSAAANDYVWKEETAVAGTRFEAGSLPINRGKSTDWNAVYDAAKRGDLDGIPKDIVIRNYSSIKRIRVDNMVNIPRPAITVNVFYGGSGLGKSRRAWLKLALMHISRILIRNGGMVIVARQMLLLMSLLESLILLICFVGWIVILAKWK